MHEVGIIEQVKVATAITQPSTFTIKVCKFITTQLDNWTVSVVYCRPVRNPHTGGPRGMMRKLADPIPNGSLQGLTCKGSAVIHQAPRAHSGSCIQRTPVWCSPGCPGH